MEEEKIDLKLSKYEMSIWARNLDLNLKLHLEL